jgi:hypothetical protein
MEFNKPNPNPVGGSEFSLDKYADLVLDDKMAKNIIGDLRKHLPPGGFPKNKPLLVPSAALKVNPSSALKK